MPWRVPLYRTPDDYADLRDFEAYPNGLQFTLLTRFRPGTLDRRDRYETMARFHGPRLGVQFSDGRKSASGVEGENPFSDKEPERPILRPAGGGGGGTDFRNRYWLWPLPPTGPLTWVVAWEEHGVPEQTVVVDASALETAAAQAEKLWDVSRADVGRGWMGASSTATFRTPRKRRPSH